MVPQESGLDIAGLDCRALYPPPGTIISIQQPLIQPRRVQPSVKPCYEPSAQPSHSATVCPILITAQADHTTPLISRWTLILSANQPSFVQPSVMPCCYRRSHRQQPLALLLVEIFPPNHTPDRRLLNLGSPLRPQVLYPKSRTARHCLLADHLLEA